MSIRRLIVAYAFTAIASFALAFGFALRIGPTYTTDALLIAKEQTNSNQMSGLATATRLLGISAGGAQNSNFDKFQKYWASRDVAAKLIEKHPGLLQRLFRGDWDSQHGRWYGHPHQFREYLAIPLNWLFGVYPTYIPTAQDLALYIKGSMKLEADLLEGDVQISYSDRDPAFAQWFLSTVIAETDEAVRDAEQRRDQDFVVFARSRLEKETNVTYRDALTDALRQFEISNMYSQAGDHYSFQYVESPARPANHSAPRPLLYTVIAVIFANLVAVCITGAMLLWPSGGLARRMNAISDLFLPRPAMHYADNEDAGVRRHPI